MSGDEFVLEGLFPPVSYDEWRRLADADLEGASFEQKLVTHTYEGIDVQPLYTRRDQMGEGDSFGFPGFPPFVRGAKLLGAVESGWDLRQEHAHPDLASTNEAILEDLAGGVTSLNIRLDLAARSGFDPDDPSVEYAVGRDGVMAYRLDDLDACLTNVRLDAIAIGFDAGAAFLPAAAMLVALWRRRGVPPDQARAAWNADPIGVLAREGQLHTSAESALAMLGELAVWTSKNYPNVTAVGIDTAPYHHAGATSVQDIAFAVATGVEYLRALVTAGLDVDTAAGQLLFDLSVGTHHFLAIAKLRAARRLWSRVVQVCGGSSSAAAMRIHVRTSKRVLTQRDPYVNLLRNTVALFAAGVAGADSITSVPFDVMNGLPDSFSRRIARNTLLILQEEAHLNRVVDPAGGSWFLDCLTEQIAQKSWDLFQQIERRGGMLEALRSGWVAQQIDAAYAPRAKDIARRKEGITGISEFPDVREQRVVHPSPDPSVLRDAAIRRFKDARRDGATSPIAASRPASTDRTAAAIVAASNGASIGQIARDVGFHLESVEITPLELRTFAEPFEELRDASDAWRAAHGKGPTAFLANMGPVSHHTARASFSKNFFEAGGFDVVSNNGFRDADAAAQAFAASGATVAVICSSDKLYPEIVPPLAAKLKAAGATSVVLAGNPGANEAAWRTAGVDRFIFMKCDVLATLREMLREQGVLDQGVCQP